MTGVLRRPSVDAPSGAGGLSVELTDAARLSAEGTAWDDLAMRALATHPHYTRHVVDAHRTHGLAPADLGIVAVRRGARLDAALPYALGLDVTGFGRAVARPFRSPFVTGTAPLVAADTDGRATFDTLVAGLRQASGGRTWRWPLLSVETPAGAGLLDAMRRAGWSLGEVAAFERPVLARRADHDAFLTGHPHAGRLKDLRRRRRRLAEAGHVAFEVATGGEPLAAAVERFLALEMTSWKGRAGTAMASRPRTEAFARTLFHAGAGPVSVRADTLSLEGRPLAVSLALVVGGTACLLKTAYAEAARSHAPGLVLEAEIVQAMHGTGFADRLDSATLAGSALESLYRERERVAEIVAVPPGGGSLLDIDRRVRLARFEHRARDEAKRLLRKD